MTDTLTIAPSEARGARTKLGLSLREVAKRADIDHVAVWQFERSAEIAEKVAAVLDAEYERQNNE